MALVLLQSGREPLGQFDGYDADYLSVKGGEVGHFANAAYPTSGTPAGAKAAGYDTGVFDAFDGYVPETLLKSVSGMGRPAVTVQFAAADAYAAPLFLVDDGSSGAYANGFAGAGYGTLFGQVVGGVGGQVTTGGAVLGPHTATGSGKLTIWDKPGLYGVTLDAVDTSASTGVVPANTALTVGTPLGCTSSGLLTMAAGASNALAGSGGNPTTGTWSATKGACAFLVEFSTGGQLVTTPNYLVAALNSPSSSISSAQTKTFKFAVINWLGHSK